LREISLWVSATKLGWGDYLLASLQSPQIRTDLSSGEHPDKPLLESP
jgi:hypothetical protein